MLSLGDLQHDILAPYRLKTPNPVTSVPPSTAVQPPITMGLLPLTYRRPAYVDKNNNPLSDEPSTGQNTISNSPARDSEAGSEKTEPSLRPVNSGSIAGIPTALSFDVIIEGGTCPVSA